MVVGLWALAGACLTAGLATAFTVGPALLLAGVVLAVLLARRGVDASAAGLAAGAGLPLLVVAALDRAGPGRVCSHLADAESCVDVPSPWPWPVVGVALVAAGVAGTVLGRSAADGQPD